MRQLPHQGYITFFIEYGIVGTNYFQCIDVYIRRRHSALVHSVPACSDIIGLEIGTLKNQVAPAIEHPERTNTEYTLSSRIEYVIMPV